MGLMDHSGFALLLCPISPGPSGIEAQEEQVNVRKVNIAIRDIVGLRIDLSLKTVQLSPPIFGQFCEKIKLIFCFSPKYLGLPVLTKYFVKKELFVS